MAEKAALPDRPPTTKRKRDSDDVPKKSEAEVGHEQPGKFDSYVEGKDGPHIPDDVRALVRRKNPAVFGTVRNPHLSTWQAHVEQTTREQLENKTISTKSADALVADALRDVERLHDLNVGREVPADDAQLRSLYQTRTPVGTPRGTAIESVPDTVRPTTMNYSAAAASYAASVLENTANPKAVLESMVLPPGAAVAVEGVMTAEDYAFSKEDRLHWAATTAKALGTRLIRGGRKYKKPNLADDHDAEIPLSDTNHTVLVMGDWGTNSEEAAGLILAAKQVANPNIVIHLGDVYYAGLAGEAQDFTKLLKKVFNNQELILNLPGNHDYYSGGHPFYKQLKELSGGRQTKSFFNAFNSKWQLQGMDTGYHDSNPVGTVLGTTMTELNPKEVSWHRNKLNEAASNQRKVILLSHHQPFTACDRVGGDDSAVNTNLLKQLHTGLPVDQRRIPGLAAWYFGHEHNQVIYKPYTLADGNEPYLTRGRLIGHGAVPVLYDSMYDIKKFKPGHTVPEFYTDEHRKLRYKEWKKDKTHVSTHGFTILRLGKDGTGEADYYEIWYGKAELRFTEDLASKAPRFKFPGQKQFQDI